jgi:succinate-semialdehyde dehydrogenase/glutarate-semialdehyde dehydrogenase
VEAAVRARCINSGQSCIAAKRVIVADSIYDKFEVRFVARMIAMKVGDPTREETDVGPLATAAQVEQLDSQVQAAIRAGARTLTGGRRREGQGNYYEPTVLTGVPRDCGVFREELFGPVAMLFRVRDAEEAIGLANDSPFGLGASVWTRSHAEQKQFALGLQCGGVFLNAPVSSDPRLPFGGIKHSGYGRELSAAGMREFLNAKTVVIADPLAADVPDNGQERVVAEGEPARLEVAVRQQASARPEAAAVAEVAATPEEDAAALLSRLSIISRKTEDSK